MDGNYFRVLERNKPQELDQTENSHITYHMLKLNKNLQVLLMDKYE